MLACTCMLFGTYVMRVLCVHGRGRGLRYLRYIVNVIHLRQPLTFAYKQSES